MHDHRHTRADEAKGAHLLGRREQGRRRIGAGIVAATLCYSGFRQAHLASRAKEATRAARDATRERAEEAGRTKQAVEAANRASDALRAERDDYRRSLIRIHTIVA